MIDEIQYDVYAMKAAGAEAAQLLQEIRRKTDLLSDFSMDKNDDGRNIRNLSASDKKTFIDAVQRLRAVCNGYERLLQYMDAAANVYGLTERTIQENIDF